MAITPPTDKIDWANIGFQYRDTNGYMKYTWTEEKGWDREGGVFETDAWLKVHVSSPGLNYGQQCFEGLKAFRDTKGEVRIFRPDVNALRLNRSAAMVSMPDVPTDLFLEAVRETVERNLEFVPPAGTGGSLYLRPLLFGNGPYIGMGPAPEFTFVVFGMPVGNFYQGGVTPVDALVMEEFDRTAPKGTGATKVGGNYAPTFGPMKKAKMDGYAITLHLDSKTRTYIDEFSTSNFVALTHADPITGKRTFVTPNSASILRSVTRLSLEKIAEALGWAVEERSVKFSEIEDGHFAEVAACGTAAIITPVRKIMWKDKEVAIGAGDQMTEIGEGFKQLYDIYRGIQNGDDLNDSAIQEVAKEWMWPQEGIHRRP